MSKPSYRPESRGKLAEEDLRAASRLRRSDASTTWAKSGSGAGASSTARAGRWRPTTRRLTFASCSLPTRRAGVNRFLGMSNVPAVRAPADETRTQRLNSCVGQVWPGRSLTSPSPAHSAPQG